MNGSWTDDDDEDPPEDGQEPLPPGANRVTVEVICCPRCRTIAIRRISFTPAVSYWECTVAVCRHSWRDSGEIGGKGRAHIA